MAYLENLLQKVLHFPKVPKFRQVVLAQEGHNNKRSSGHTWNREHVQARDYVIRGVVSKFGGRKALEDLYFFLAISVVRGWDTKFEDNLRIIGQTRCIQYFDRLLKTVSLVRALVSGQVA